MASRAAYGPRASWGGEGLATIPAEVTERALTSAWRIALIELQMTEAFLCQGHFTDAARALGLVLAEESYFD